MLAWSRVNTTGRKNTTDGPFVIGKIEVTKHEQMKTNMVSIILNWKCYTSHLSNTS